METQRKEMSDSRLTAVLILRDILERQIFLNEAKSRNAVKDNGAFINMLLLTTLRRLCYVENILKKYITRKIPAKQKAAWYALILGTVEILWLETPNYAAINSYVECAKKLSGKYVGGLVNAVLRKIAAGRQELLNEKSQPFFPPRFRELLHKSYDTRTLAAIENAARQEPPLDITLKHGATFPAGKILPGGSVRLPNNGNISELPGYGDGNWWVQDFSSALAVKMLPDIRNRRVLDLCAAPGGKTAQLIDAGARVTALDISKKRLQTLRENLERLRFQTEQTICADAADYLENFNEEPYDIILLDAPCSATGTLRRHPELVHIKTEKDVLTQSAIQQKLLTAAEKALNRNGLLLYCTCSLCRSEGEDQILTFLNRNKRFRTVNLQQSLPQELQSLADDNGFIRILPAFMEDCGGADGFFIALLQKVSA